MRWALFIILVYAAMLVQTTIGGILAINVGIGPVCPDLLAVLAVFFALRLRTMLDALLAAWLLGMGIDMTLGGVGAGAAGPMALAYVAGAAAAFSMREALFRERPLAQAVLTFLFCLMSHGLWVTLQSLLSWGRVGWGEYGGLAATAALVAVYTALVAPLVHFVLIKCDRWFVPAPSSRRGGR